ncbi:MAG: peptidoglycan-binding domain-containing protein [Candidatus Nanopelagicales bacterium]
MSTTTAAPRTGRIVAISAATALAVAAVLGTVVVMVGRDASATPSSSSSSSSTGGNNHTVEPSNAIKTIQSELAELNFYDGPINGYDTQQTVDAVKNLQRQAGLPQTGHMNTETRDALLRYLAQGDNVMNG